MSKVELVKNAMLAVQRYPWEQGVCMQAVFESGDIKTAVAMAHDAVLRQKEDGRLAVINDNIAVTDPAANGEMVYRAYEITGNKFYLDAANRMLDYLMNVAPKTDSGILYHNEVSFHEGFTKDQIWVDSMYMAPPFIAIMGELDEAVKQLLGMYDYLIDQNTGLLKHIYDVTSDKFVRNKLWASGNGWALLGIARVIDVANMEGRENLKSILIEKYVGILEAMLRYQLEDGRFHDFLDEEDSFVEGAAAMMMAASIYRGRVMGWLDEKYIEYANKVIETMDSYVDEFGIIHEVCGCPHFVSVGTSAESMAAYLMMHGWHKTLTFIDYNKKQ